MSSGLRALGTGGVCALGASLALAACGGSSPSTTATDAAANAEQKAVEFARCLREHGIEASSSSSRGRIRMKVTGDGAPQKFEAAQKSCARYQPKQGPANLSPAERATLEDHVQKFAKCMREHGIHVEASARAGGVGIGIRIGRGERGPNPEGPAFQAAQKACESLLPKPPHGAPGLRTKAGPAPGGGHGPATQSAEGEKVAPGR
jgi:hypothetical protein